MHIQEKRAFALKQREFTNPNPICPKEVDKMGMTDYDFWILMTLT